MTEREGDGQTNMELERVETKIAGVRNMFNQLESAGFTQHSRFRLDQDITDQNQAIQFLSNYRRVGQLKERILDRAIPRLESDLERIGQVESEQSKLPQMEINPETRMVRIGDRIISFTGTRLERQWRLLMRLAQNAGEVVPTKELEPIVRESGARGQNPVGQSVANLRINLEEDPKHPKLLISAWHGKDSGHSLQVSVRKEEERLGPFDVKLSDGLVVKTAGPWEAQALRKLNEMGRQHMSLDELSNLLFGDSKYNYLSRTIGIIRKLNTLLPVGVKQIVWDQTDVWLQDKHEEETEKGAEGTQTEEVSAKHRLEFLENNQVELDGRRIKLSPKEFSILHALAKHVNEEVISRILCQEALNSSDPRSASLNPVIQDIKRKLNQPEILDSKLASVNSWFKLQNVEVVWPEELQREAEGTPPTITEEEPFDLLTKEEAAVIASLLVLDKNKPLLAKHGFEVFPKENEGRLASDREEQTLEKDEVQKLRIRALEHMRNLLNSDQVEKIFDRHESDIQNLFVYFADREKAFDLLEDLLSADIELSWRVSKSGEVVDINPVVIRHEPGITAEVTGLQVQTSFVYKEKPLVPEVRTQLETGTLRVIIDQISKYTRLDFLELQKALYKLAIQDNVQDRFASFWGIHHFRVFQPREIHQIFSEAFRKIRFQDVNTAEDLDLLKDLSSVMERVSGGDARRFERSIEVLIDNAERDFYNTYKTATGEKIIWLNIDRLGA